MNKSIVKSPQFVSFVIEVIEASDRTIKHVIEELDAIIVSTN